MNRNSLISTTLGLPTLIANFFIYSLSILGFNCVTWMNGPCSYRFKNGIICCTFSFETNGCPLSSALIGFYVIFIFACCLTYIEVDLRPLSRHSLHHLFLQDHSLCKLMILKLHNDSFQLFEAPLFQILTVSYTYDSDHDLKTPYIWSAANSIRNPVVHGPSPIFLCWSTLPSLANPRSLLLISPCLTLQVTSASSILPHDEFCCPFRGINPWSLLLG